MSSTHRRMHLSDGRDIQQLYPLRSFARYRQAVVICSPETGNGLVCGRGRYDSCVRYVSLSASRIRLVRRPARRKYIYLMTRRLAQRLLSNAVCAVHVVVDYFPSLSFWFRTNTRCNRKKRITKNYIRQRKSRYPN